ncbi:NACHT, LRR and PYD domains-containing protein 12-like [Chanos chanos]|uniref:NACHT, LRR and PYD domains-containing protein 12-like n=1 Tax=Chanos chanos TaxID=29144 RepID=A0A6J2W518_CHACN|nr:NACHT, LRR and PYD domains-containing protein 12-like [Chanos chanos]
MSGEAERSTASEMSLSKKHPDTESFREKTSESPTQDSSKDFNPPCFREGDLPSEKSGMEKRSESPTQSCVSMKSEASDDQVRPNLRDEELPPEKSVTEKRSESPTHSSVSMKSEASDDQVRPDLRDGELASEKRHSCGFKGGEALKDQKFHEVLRNIFSGISSTLGGPLVATSLVDLCVGPALDLEEKVITFMKHELKRIKKFLKTKNMKDYDRRTDDYNSAREGAANITLHCLRNMNQNDLADTLEKCLIIINLHHELKSRLKRKYEHAFEGITKQGESVLLEKIYTELYITEGGSGAVNEEHEVRQSEKAFGRPETPEKLIECNNIFNPLPGQDKTIRTVLTKGVAGIGKSISVQKFIVDWAEGKANQDIEFIFPLPFRELNLKNGEHSLMDILNQFFPETKGIDFTKKIKYKVLFIFDGLDECRHPLRFQKNETWSDVTKPASVDVLLTNLIRGNLLPSALIWITTRPAAASKIPPECVDQVVEVRGFNDTQKEEYFRKRITDEKLADRIISHMKQSRSLYIMCHIPVFCWISATVLERILGGTDSTDKQETLKTLTQMYSYFLIFQTRQKNQKYEETESMDTVWDEKSILAMGKLAFQNLLSNNLIFYAQDLKECGIDVTDASVYSGMCTQIFKEESGMFLGTVFCFVHLSIQEYIAALYAYMSTDKYQKNVFVNQETSLDNESNTVIGLLRTAVDKALESESGHLDLFLRFLLGLSLESNQRLLQGLLTQTGSSSQSKEDIVRYIKEKFKEDPSEERSINLFHCLNELNDKSLVEEIQNHLSSGSLSSAQLSPAQWSALVFVLLTSEEQMEVFDLKKFIRSDECLKRLLPVVKSAQKALLSDCQLTEESCSALATVLRSDQSTLRELDLSNNKIQDSGVKQLSAGLENSQCKLEKLKLKASKITGKGCAALTSALTSNPSHLIELNLSGNKLRESGVKHISALLENSHCKLERLNVSDCSITGEGYAALASVLKSNPSHLVELDLRGNNPGDSAVKLLSDLLNLLNDQKCKLKTLRLLKRDAAEKACVYLTEVLGINPLLLTELDLSGKKLGHSGMKQLSALLRDSHCKVKTLKLNKCGLTEQHCSVLAEILSSGSSNLTHLDLSRNNLQDSGVKRLSAGLKNPHLQKLKLSDCSITLNGYAALATALRSNPSHLIELDLRGNDPGYSGVKQLTDLQKDPKCKLQTLRLLKSDAAEKACAYLTSLIGRNPLLQTELDLSEKKQGDSGVKQFCALLEDSHCKVKKLKLNDSSITEEGCVALTSALRSNPSHLIELNLSGNKLGDSGVKHICSLLENPHCKLEKLELNDNNITEEGCDALTSALTSNPSHLIELNLSGNKLGDSGVKHISDLLGNPHCKLQKLLFNDSNITEEGCAALTSALTSNPSHLIELNLSGNKLGEAGAKHISALLENSNCKLQRLLLNDSSITEEGCAALTSALTSNPSHLIELNLSGNKLGDSGVKHISALLGNPQCTLQRLLLNDISITEEGCAALTSALTSNPSHLIELNLSGNKLGDSGVKHISDMLQNPQCKLQRLLLDTGLLSTALNAFSTVTSFLWSGGKKNEKSDPSFQQREPDSHSAGEKGEQDSHSDGENGKPGCDTGSDQRGTEWSSESKQTEPESGNPHYSGPGSEV